MTIYQAHNGHAVVRLHGADSVALVDEPDHAREVLLPGLEFVAAGVRLEVPDVDTLDLTLNKLLRLRAEIASEECHCRTASPASTPVSTWRQDEYELQLPDTAFPPEPGIVELALRRGFTHVKTYGGEIALEWWRPYGLKPEDVAGARFRLKGNAIIEEQVEMAGSNQVWPLVRR